MKALLAVAALAVAVAAQTPARAPQADVESGRRLYMRYGCYQCHGREAQGASTTGPRLGPDPLTFAEFVRATRQPTAEMPPYTAKVATDRELADIYAFVTSRPRPPGRIPLLEDRPPAEKR